ncbi:unnamed protein product [Oncorhynchus mykiss]|uniref:Uncharacterized protein n=1 Tax=Oncorhynchus mykiss TaxID=8022 RepID=A0A060Z682_ONCMY|nr:unnamed protein product [Oncorhynchus mykiss]
MWQLHIPHCPPKLTHWLQTVRNSNKLKTHTFICRLLTIYRRDEGIRHQIHSTWRPLQHRDLTMAPTITSAIIYSNEHLTLTNKIRKPVVEKLHRDRFNNSIEQLKSLLERASTSSQISKWRKPTSWR